MPLVVGGRHRARVAALISQVARANQARICTSMSQELTYAKERIDVAVRHW